MYVVKITKEKQILAVRHYEKFQNALAEIIHGTVFEDLEDDIIPREIGRPELSYHSIDEDTNTADDFEFRYPDGLLVYLGEILVMDRTEGRK